MDEPTRQSYLRLPAARMAAPTATPMAIATAHPAEREIATATPKATATATPVVAPVPRMALPPFVTAPQNGGETPINTAFGVGATTGCDDKPVIAASGVRKTYRTGARLVDAVDGIDLVVSPGEFVGILGPNGAGKTSLIEILEGIRVADEGSVTILGVDASDARSMKRMRARMGISLQHSVLPPLMTVEEILNLQRRLYASRVDPDQVMDMVGLDEQRAKRISTLSGGQQQRVAIAMALMGDPELMFLDEPTSQLDPHARLALWELLYSQRARRNTAVVITTHQMEEAQRICDRVLIMDRGRIIAEGRPDDLVRTHFHHRKVLFSTDSAVRPSAGPSARHKTVRLRDGRIRHEILSEAPLALLARLSSEHGDALSEVSIVEPTLEELFLKLTSHASRSLDHEA